VKPLTWIVGRGGLLGSCVEQELRSDLWYPDSPIMWDDLYRVRESIAHAVQGFVARMLLESRQSWCVYWCAGSGVVGTSSTRLAAETESLRFFLETLGNALNPLRVVPVGRLFLASSAGGVYGGSIGHPLTELTLPQPISDYGRAKLEQEDLVVTWARAQPKVSILVGRLSNLYGPRQRLDKPQGLISHISRCILFSSPLHIYVPLDTLRDYLFASDAARDIVGGVARLEREWLGTSLHLIKIYSSGKETTISTLIGIFRRVAKRQLRVVMGLSNVRLQQPARLQFRSIIWNDSPAIPRTDLLDGVNRVHRHQFALFQAGRLPPP
jgi:UDP-glucose 4-epimerase